jgi:hypothetical protein
MALITIKDSKTINKINLWAFKGRTVIIIWGRNHMVVTSNITVANPSTQTTATITSHSKKDSTMAELPTKTTSTAVDDNKTFEKTPVKDIKVKTTTRTIIQGIITTTRETKRTTITISRATILINKIKTHTQNMILKSNTGTTIKVTNTPL